MYAMPVPAVPPGAALVTLDARASVRGLGPAATPLWPGARTYAVPIRPGPATVALQRLRTRADVVAVEVNRRRTSSDRGSGVPSDPSFPQQGYLREIDWSLPEPPLRQPIVAVLDTGVSPVPDLVGHIDGARAATFVAGREPLMDIEGHGTHVAGIIAALTDNAIGISGVADAMVLPIAVGAADGDQTVATSASLIQGLRYAVDQGAKIVNISFAGSGYSALEQTAINDATRAGVLVVAASGNTGPAQGGRQYPGAYRHVLAVGATGPGGLPLAVSTRGPQVAVAAPGSDILSTGTSLEGTGSYVTRTGTSVAAPMVSGAAARLLARDPTLRPSQLRAMVVETARDIAPSGVDEQTGHGLVDLASALTLPAPPPDAAEPDDDPKLAARLVPLLQASVRRREIGAELAGWSDPRDCRLVILRRGQTLDLTLSSESTSDLDLVVWRPGTPPSALAGRRPRPWTIAASLGPSATERVRFTASRSGAYIVEVRLSGGPGGRYRLRASRESGSPR
jgi:subtilisin family serine protease